MKIRTAYVSVTALAAALSFSLPAFAQAGGGAALPDGEIVVTATRNETLASKTPVALTAVSGDALLSAGVTNPTSLGEQVPNLSIDRNNGLQITIRGVSSSDGTEKGDPSAAFMADGIYIARPQVQEVSFFDVQRVEVLRGPQGTLFGRNTTAGLVNIITNKPKLGEFSGSIDATYGNFDTQQLTGVVNIPVSQGIAIRAAANYDRRDNYLVAGPNWNARLDPFKKNFSGRLSALFDLGSGELVLRGDYSAIKGTGYNTVPVSNFYADYQTTGVDPLYIANGSSSAEKRTLNAPFSGPIGSDNSTWGIQADLSYDLGPVTLNYLGSYREFKRHEDGAFLVDGGGATIANPYDGSYWQNSQELRFSTNGDGPIKAQAGIYYFKEKSAIASYLLGFLTPTPGATGYAFGVEQDPTIAESWAGFGQLTYSITPSLRLTGGIRYSHDNKSRIGQFVQCGTVACGQPTDLSTPNIAHRKFSKTTWRIGADYDVNDRTLFYGVIATGYKAGGFNDGCEQGTNSGCTVPAGALYYNPETLTSYEAGLKTRFMNNAVRLNASAFHYDYKSIQLSQFSDTLCGTPCRVTTNASSAKVDGVELEGVIMPVTTSKFDFSFSWLNARYTSFIPAPGFDWTGKKLDRSPTFVVTAGYMQTFNLANGGNVQAGVRTRLSDDYRLASLSTVNQFRVPSNTRTDLLLTYNAPDNRWYLQGFVRNVENSIVVTAAQTGIFASAQLADPRTYGVRAGVNF